MLSTVDTLASHATAADLVRLAAWYHDAVYDLRRDDNEERSAGLVEVELAALGLPAAGVARVASLVRVTAGHDAPPGDSDAEVLCDADLAVLGGPRPAYDSNVAAVRREYSHVDEVGWQAGRGRCFAACSTGRGSFVPLPEAPGSSPPGPTSAGSWRRCPALATTQPRGSEPGHQLADVDRLGTHGDRALAGTYRWGAPSQADAGSAFSAAAT